jgi:D-alanyl-D-alanine carboxypeptidase
METRLHATRRGGLAVILAATSLLAACARPTPEAAAAMIGRELRKAAKDRPDRAGASILVHSDRLGLHAMVRLDAGGSDAYHVASIGKTMTAVLVGRLIDAGRLSMDDRVAPLLAPGAMDDLFVVGGVDMQERVTVGMLLGHTSGVADYFADPARDGTTVSRLIVQDPGRAWTPAMLLDFTRQQHAAVGAPGSVYHYSDTGYILLGLLVERLAGAPLHAVLQREVFEPLGMTRTWMPFRSSPLEGAQLPIRPAWLGGRDVSAHPGITADWAGGGIASTEEDLLRFQRALWSGKLLGDDTLASMQEFRHHFQKGILSGKGLMQLRFGEFFFMLGSYPPMVGHMGILGTQMFYAPSKDIHVIVNLGSDAAVEDSVRLMIRVLGILLRMG